MEKTPSGDRPPETDLQALVQSGLRAHQEGQLTKAKAAYKKVLNAAPNHADANHLLGMIARQTGDPDHAVQLFAKAIQANPGFATCHNNLGNAFMDLCRPDDAIDSYRKAISINPDFAEAHGNLGAAFRKLDRMEEAIASFRMALDIHPDIASTHFNLGNALRNLGQLDDAANSYRQAIAISPGIFQMHENLARTLHTLGHISDAAASFENALAIDPQAAGAHAGLATLRIQQGRTDDAIDSYRRAVAIRPDFAEAHIELGTALKKKGLLDDAVASFTRAIEIDPEIAIAHNNLGNALADLGRTGDDVASYQKAIALAPDFAQAHSNLGLALKMLGRMDEAVASCRKALALDPDLAEAHSNLGLALLGMGKLQEGLDEYEWRWRVPTCNSSQSPFQKPLWNGTDDLAGRTLLLWPEQGPGDMIIWASGIPEIIDRAGRCIIEVHPKLVSLFARSFPEAEVRPDGRSLNASPAEDFDVHLPLGSLFRHLHQDLTAPCDAFLAPDPDRVAFWKQRLAELGPGPNVGISWKSPMMTPARALNYTRIDEWAPLFSQTARFINLECGDDHDDRIHAQEHLGVTVHNFDDLNLYDDLDDVAALTAALDVVISVSNVMAPLSAAVGTPVWLIAWRQSSWNNFLLAARGPDVTHFERNTEETWAAVFGELAERLRDWAENWAEK